MESKIKDLGFTIEHAVVDDPAAYDSGLYTNHVQMALKFPNVLRWDHTPLEISHLAEEHIKMANDTINALVKVDVPRTFENTIKPLAKFDHDWSTMTTSIGFYSQVSTSKEMRAASKAYEKQIGSFQTDLYMREDYYKAIKDYKTQADKDGSFSKLDKES